MTTTLDKIVRPQWMTDDFLKTSIRNSEHLTNSNELQIDDVILTYVVPKGENFMSVMLRAGVKYRIKSVETNLGNSLKPQDLSLIIKVEHENQEQFLLATSVFLIEFNMYKNLFPAFDNILKNNNIKTRLACRCLNTIEDNNPRVLVLDDLKAGGYVMTDKNAGMDLKHCKVLIKKYAELHAASMQHFSGQEDSVKLMYKKSPIYDFTEDAIYTRASTKLRRELLLLVKVMSENSHKYENLIKRINVYLERMHEYKHGENFIIDSKFNALLHGDCWTNNLMFRYTSDGSVDDVIFVDLQGCYYGSVTKDFLFFIFTSVAAEVRQEHFQYLKNFYLESLVNTLKSVKYTGPLPTMEEFNEELKNNFSTAFLSICLVLPVITAKMDEKMRSRDDSIAISREQLQNMAEKNKNDRFEQEALISLVILEEQGIFDLLK